MQDLTQRNRLSATVVLYHSGVEMLSCIQSFVDSDVYLDLYVVNNSPGDAFAFYCALELPRRSLLSCSAQHWLWARKQPYLSQAEKHLPRHLQSRCDLCAGCTAPDD